MLPNEVNAFMPFLRILSDTPGKTVSINRVALELLKHYPEITELDRVLTTASGSKHTPWYQNRVRQVKRKLVKAGLVTYDKDTQRCTITRKGELALLDGWDSWKAKYSPARMPAGVRVSNVRDRDPILEPDTICDAEVLSIIEDLYGRVAKGKGANRKVWSMFEKLISDLKYRINVT